MTVRVAGAGERQFWAYEQLHEDGDATLLVGAFELDGELDVSTVRFATKTLIQRHEILRSEFRRVGGDVTVVRHEAATVPVDVDTVVARNREEAVAVAHRLASQPVALDRPPLLRVALVSWTRSRHILVLVSHHAVLDGAALGVLAGEFGRLVDPTSEPLPDPVSLSELRAAEETRRTSNAWQRDIDYWCDQLALVESDPSVSGDPSRPADSDDKYIDTESTDRLRRLASRLRASPTIVLLALWADHLFEHRRASAVVIGVPVSGRADPRHRAVVGLLMNTIPLVVPHTEGTFTERVAAVRRVFLQGLRHHRAPLVEVARAARPGQSLEVAPLYWAMFSQGEQSTLTFGGHAVERMPMGGDTTDAPVSFVMVEEASGGIRTSLSIEDGFAFGDGGARGHLERFHSRLTEVLSGEEGTAS
ncbi:MAG TPA: hypothetical protein H9881_10850 [Candidatus Stackebrandtia excrementipullorum]|nr:hypothetical protein [Candidatus Stackebrandtia excrementipullorum]